MIESIEKSERAGKRYKAIYQDANGKSRTIHFGSEGANTYIDGASDKTRENYLKRHLANARERYLIENNIMSPALLSAKLLWGETRNLITNLARLNRRL